MGRRLSGVWVPVNRSQSEENLGSAGSRSEAGIGSLPSYLHPELLAPDSFGG